MKKFLIPYKVKRYIKIIIGNLLITGAYAFITVPNKIVNGGVTSFSMILEQITSINLTYLVNFITLLLMLCCYLFLGKIFFSRYRIQLYLLSCFLFVFSRHRISYPSFSCFMYDTCRSYCRNRILFLYQCRIHSSRI